MNTDLFFRLMMRGTIVTLYFYRHLKKPPVTGYVQEFDLGVSREIISLSPLGKPTESQWETAYLDEVADLEVHSKPLENSDP